MLRWVECVVWERKGVSVADKGMDHATRELGENSGILFDALNLSCTCLGASDTFSFRVEGLVGRGLSYCSGRQ